MPTCGRLWVALLWGSHAAGQLYPVKPVRLLVGFPGGSTTDIIAPTYGAKLSESLGRQIVVENRAGAGANIAAEAAANFAAMPVGLPLYRAGKVKALAVSSA